MLFEWSYQATLGSASPSTETMFSGLPPITDIDDAVQQVGVTFSR